MYAKNVFLFFEGKKSFYTKLCNKTILGHSMLILTKGESYSLQFSKNSVQIFTILYNEHLQNFSEIDSKTAKLLSILFRGSTCRGENCLFLTMFKVLLLPNYVN